ncbi:TATA box-binding protein-associated factor RNA polymerase I subunit B isoform X2 [Melanotaenia boesemani]|uniref:TATA box-binding protein-associated factor RNA polymerase I subunit B isoform X2 n=1 Tax=Melanotaenia boesemani TaxID=1250792 RepID=UPI001C0549DF|nr:TATA box-binding protein-associated factor RNA polymerase I subunit B isoform X2 [Melanotaenia boesemani]
METLPAEDPASVHLQPGDQLKVYSRWDSDSDSAPGSSVMSASATDRESNPPSSAGSNTESGSEWSSSTNDLRRLTSRRRRSQSRMTMVKTLALIHLALVWSREALTLSDLLRLVKEGHIPYVNAYEELPEEMKLFGKDALLFSVLSIPSHNTLHREAQALVQFLQLPAFPPISRQTLLHPALLSLRFLTDANLPDELHRWVCRLMDRAGMADPRGFTINPQSHGILPRYEVQTAALIIVTMKLIFGLDDHTEWELSNQVSSQDDSDDQFNLRRWYRLMQAALIRAQKKADQDVARKQWRTKKPIFLSKGEKNLIMKRKRNAEQVQMCFEKLSSCPAGVQDISPSSFRFCWGDKDGSDGPSLHHMKVDRVLTQKLGTLTPQNSLYWHPALKSCSTLRKCRSHYSEVEATLPRSFVWLLQLFSFILDVKPYYLYEEVLEVERKVFGAKHAMYPKGKKKKRRTETRTGTSSRVVQKSGGKS